MWGGRFGSGPDAIMREINASIPFDKRLWREDIAGSRAHATMLAAQGIINAYDNAVRYNDEHHQVVGVVVDAMLPVFREPSKAGRRSGR